MVASGVNAGGRGAMNHSSDFPGVYTPGGEAVIAQATQGLSGELRKQEPECTLFRKIF